jgi:hypothetical protein
VIVSEDHPKPAGVDLSTLAQGPTLPEASYMEEPTDNLESQNITNVIHSLTMPPVPNFDIPPSPPGSPPAGPTAKFAQFLAMKKPSINHPAGVHFNARLPDSISLKNPAFLDRMMNKAGISVEGSHALAEPDVLALPTSWPEWAQADELNKMQKRVAKRKERPTGERVQFVPAASR